MVDLIYDLVMILVGYGAKSDRALDSGSLHIHIAIMLQNIRFY